MKIISRIILSFFILSIFLSGFKDIDFADNNFVIYIINPKSKEIKLYWKDDKGQIFKTFQNLKTYLEKYHQKLIFAMNGGMFTGEKSPQGVYIENYKTIIPLNRDTGYGNFYMKPNGVFFVNSKNEVQICKTEFFPSKKEVKYATQSGPMLITNGKINSKFNKNSESLFVRNGVGILSNGSALFVMSKNKINLYNFAQFFRRKGCQNALYLDGYVSRTYLPKENWRQLDGEFGVIIGVCEDE